MLAIIFIIIISTCPLPSSKIPKRREKKVKTSRGNKDGFGLLLKVNRRIFHDSQKEDVVVKLGRNQDSICGSLLVKTLLARTFEI